MIYYKYFNSLTRSQIANPKTIPIIIISYNRVSCLKVLIDNLLEKNYTNIIVVDNKSDMLELLAYYETIITDPRIRINFLKKNYGHKVIWDYQHLFGSYLKGYFVITDPDIIPVRECPDDFLRYFMEILNKEVFLTKVGFSLVIDDIPSHNINRDSIIKWESQFYLSPDQNGNFKAKIDTTFALYRPMNFYFKGDDFYQSLRCKFPFFARHLTWYVDSNSLDIEFKYYSETANNSFSWKTNHDGSLVDEKKIYK